MDAPIVTDLAPIVQTHPHIFEYPPVELCEDRSEHEWFARVPDLGRYISAPTRERLVEAITEARRVAREHYAKCPSDAGLSAGA